MLGGYFGRRVDAVVAGLFDVLLSVPALILALAFTVFLGPEVRNMILALGIVAVPQLGRITRANALAWSQHEFVLAARAQGARNRRIIVREVLPNVLPSMFSVALLGVAVAIVAEGGLSLLGAGVQDRHHHLGHDDRGRARRPRGHAVGGARPRNGDLPHGPGPQLPG